VRRGLVHAQLRDQPGEAGRLALGEVEHQARERGRVDDRMLERALQPATDEPGVEGVVAVLDQDGALRKPQKSASRVFELRRPDQHRAVDVVSLARVRVDGRPAVDQRVEERERAVEAEPLGPYLEDQERSVARGLDVQGDELRVGQRRLAADLRRIDGDLLPRHQRRSPSGLEEHSL